MKNWKIYKRTFDGTITKEFIEFFDVTTMPNVGDTLYYCYRRKWLFFWKLKNIKTQNEWNQTISFMNHDGYRVNDMCNCVNF